MKVWGAGVLPFILRNRLGYLGPGCVSHLRRLLQPESKYKKVHSCKFSKERWDILALAYESTSQCPKPSRQRSHVKIHEMKTILMRTNYPSSQGRSNPCGSTREDQDERTTSRSTPRKLKTRHKWCVMNVKNQDTSNPNVLTLKKIKKMRKGPSSKRRKASWLFGKILTCHHQKMKMKKQCLMPNIT
ncbi:hypothetical protein CR513_05624, partial [Mucuna pruriens]